MLNRLRGKLDKRNSMKFKSTNDHRKVINMPLTSLEDVPLIEMSIENGNIIILSISTIKYNQQVTVKRVVQTLNAYTRKFGGDIAQLGRDFIIIVPPGIDLAVANEAPKNPKEPESPLASRQHQKRTGNTYREPRSSIDQLQGHYQKDVARSEVEDSLKDPIFGL